MAKKNTKKNAKKRRIRRRRITIAAVLAVLVLIAGYVFLFGGPAYRDRSDPVATVTLSGGKKMLIELFPLDAPESVGAFIDLAQQGYYDGLTLNTENGCLLISGKPVDFGIRGEFPDNGINNPNTHGRGAVGLSRRTAYDSADGGFYLMLSDSPWLDGANAVFGNVVKGMEYADKIASGDMKPVIESIRVDTKGRAYGYEKYAK